MTRRARITWILVAVAILTGCALRVALAARPYLRHRAHLVAFGKSMEELGALGVRELAAMGGTPVVDLKAACAGKLAKVEPQAILSYFGPLPDKLSGYSMELPHDQLYGFGLYPVEQLSLLFQEMPYETSRYTARSLWDFVFDKSDEWDNMVDRFRASSPLAEKGRYLLVHRIVGYTLPDYLGDGTFKAGTALVQVRVLEAPSGQLLCEGTVSPRTSNSVTSHGRGSTRERASGMAEAQARKGTIVGFGQSLKVSGLDALCDLGGELLCRSTAEVINKIDVFY